MRKQLEECRAGMGVVGGGGGVWGFWHTAACECFRMLRALKQLNTKNPGPNFIHVFGPNLCTHVLIMSMSGGTSDIVLVMIMKYV